MIKYDYVRIKNIVPNASFEKDAEWMFVNYDSSVSFIGSRSARLEATTAMQSSYTTIIPIIGHKYYGREYIKSSGEIGAADNRFEWWGGDGAGLNFVFSRNDGDFPNWTMLSSVIPIDAVNSGSFVVRSFVVDAKNTCWVDGLMIVDLTETFGAGDEPSKEWCDKNIPFFEGEYELRVPVEFELTTDRTQSDVDRWKSLRSKGWSGMTEDERAEWTAGMKGAYNSSDLNRVNEAMEYLATVFASYGYAVSLLPAPEWSYKDVPTKEDMETYLSNLSSLRSVLSVLPTTPATPESMELLTYVTANNIEQILVDIELILNTMGGAFLRAGMPWAVAGNEVYVKNA